MLWIALARHDFSFVYVAEHTSRALPLGYRLAGFWGGQEGSLLLWLLILTGYAALAVWLNRRTRDLVAWVVPVLAGVASFFAFMLCFVSSPFATAPAPADGAGMVPSLQNPYMLAHPPLLYLGYVGLTIPFAFAMGALLSRPHRRALDRRRRGAGRSPPGRSSASASCSARTGPTSRSAGAATTPGIPSRTRR